MTELLTAIAQRADATHIVLSLVILALVAMLREQAKSAQERDRTLTDAMDRLSEVITELRIDLSKGRR